MEGESGKLGMMPTPNYFIAIRITDKDVISKVSHFQEWLTKRDFSSPWNGLTNTDIFKNAMVPVNVLYFPLQAMHIRGEKDLRKAQTAIYGCWKQVKQELGDDPINLIIEGLTLIGDHDESHNIRLTKLFEMFRDALDEQKIPVFKRPFVPHMVIANIKRSTKLQQMKISSFPPGFMPVCHDKINFGTQKVTGFNFYRMPIPPAKK